MSVLLYALMGTASAGWSEQDWQADNNEAGLENSSCFDWCDFFNLDHFETCQATRDGLEVSGEQQCDMYWTAGWCSSDIDGCQVLDYQPDCDISCWYTGAETTWDEMVYMASWWISRMMIPPAF